MRLKITNIETFDVYNDDVEYHYTESFYILNTVPRLREFKTLLKGKRVSVNYYNE